jgi:Holliday junction resolvasome RuvABC endonuclease subunit
MTLAALAKTRAAVVMGIDCSTRSLAFSVFDRTTPLRCGEIFFDGGNLYERLNDAHNKVPAMVEEGLLRADFVAIEGAIAVGNNVQTAIHLAYVYGAVMGGLMKEGMEVVKVNPLTWQSYIGNPNLKTAEKEAIKKANPGKSASWYKNAGREFRKQRTLEFARKFFEIPGDSDNVGDSVGIAWYAVNQLTTGGKV